MNIENFNLVLNQIKNHPETWNQHRWHCNSSHCFFGWAQILSGGKENNNTVRTDARVFLDLNQEEADYISDGYRSIKDFDGFLNFYKKYPTGCDNNGYDYFGHDHDGYDPEGYDKDGYNMDGYNRRGYDREGYDRDDLDCNNNPRQ